MHEPGEPPRPQELPGKIPDELPVRGPQGPRTPSPATDSGIADAQGLEPGGIGGLARHASGDNVKAGFETMV